MRTILQCGAIWRFPQRARDRAFPRGILLAASPRCPLSMHLSREVWRCMKCDGCEVDVIDVQTKMNFRALPAEKDWVEFPVLASICPKCGKMDLNVAVPVQFARWVAG
jgi:hypothetical protein